MRTLYFDLLVVLAALTLRMQQRYDRLFRYLDRYYRSGRHTEFFREIREMEPFELVYLHNHRQEFAAV